MWRTCRHAFIDDDRKPYNHNITIVGGRSRVAAMRNAIPYFSFYSITSESTGRYIFFQIKEGTAKSMCNVYIYIYIYIAIAPVAIYIFSPAADVQEFSTMFSHFPVVRKSTKVFTTLGGNTLYGNRWERCGGGGQPAVVVCVRSETRVRAVSRFPYPAAAAVVAAAVSSTTARAVRRVACSAAYRATSHTSSRLVSLARARFCPRTCVVFTSPPRSSSPKSAIHAHVSVFACVSMVRFFSPRSFT